MLSVEKCGHGWPLRDRRVVDHGRSMNTWLSSRPRMAVSRASRSGTGARM